jgi:selenocysteine-specific elongation factor
MRSPVQNATDPVQETVAMTVGTAGHIDHGKTMLVKLLTGCDCDRLPEEKARGMTIDLGFATCRLPDGRQVGIVDVPGHEKFIRNMVAGSAGIDAVLLIIAADDGIMPQTLEHFHIVRLLGVASGMVAITKIDLVTQDRVSEVIEQARGLVAGSFLEGCPVTPVSSKTGEGFDGFYDAFVSTINQTMERGASGPFLLHVERSFLLAGRGRIASGIPVSGRVSVGDTVELLPHGGERKVKGIQVYGEDAGEGRAGECVAIRLGNVSDEDVGRGTALATPGYFVPSKLFSAHFELLPGGERLKPRTAIRLHVGTADAPGHIVLPDLAPIAPGSHCYVQFQLDRPLVAAPHDFFVARMLSPVKTIGGGSIVAGESRKMRRSQKDWTEQCREHEKAFADPRSALEYVLRNSGDRPLVLSELARRALISQDAGAELVASIVADGAAAELPGRRYVHSLCFSEAREQVRAAFRRLHDASPMSIGFEKREVLQELRIDRLLSDHMMTLMLADGELIECRVGMSLADRAPSLSAGKQAMATRLVDMYLSKCFSTPRRDELPEILGAPASVIDPILDMLLQKGELVAVSDKVILHPVRIAEAQQKLIEYLQKHSTIDAGSFKQLLDTTRKYSIPLLEYWDRTGLTRRTGDERTLKGK